MLLLVHAKLCAALLQVQLRITKKAVLLTSSKSVRLELSLPLSCLSIGFPQRYLASSRTIAISEMDGPSRSAVEPRSPLNVADPATPASASGKGTLTFCKDFQEQATSGVELERLCFTNLRGKTADSEEGHAMAGSGGSVAEVSCASSTCSLVGNGNLSDGGTSVHGKRGVTAELGLSEQINAKLIKRTISRHGRSSQRWAADPLSHSAIRLTTGCVPIVKGGKVLFVSASSKPAWIFPKGGWENDEKLEESALRECYEEAGVIGILGPRLAEIQYETRKARKRRIETEEMSRLKRKKQELSAEARDDGKKNKKSDKSASECPSAAQGGNVTPPVVIDSSEAIERPFSASVNVAPVSDDALARMRGSIHREAVSAAKRQVDETSSLQSDASSYSQVRMVLFPLYVTSIKNEWPESGRLRRAVPIDEAIQILGTRPELQAALVEVRRRGLHLLDNSRPSREAKLPTASNII